MVRIVERRGGCCRPRL